MKEHIAYVQAVVQNKTFLTSLDYILQYIVYNLYDMLMIKPCKINELLLINFH